MSINEEQMMLEMRLIPEDLDGINTNIKTLYDIYTDFVKSINGMQDLAEHFARILNYSPEINSVKWRVKDPVGLIKKIIRKKKEIGKNIKYENIDVKNYKEIVTDLIGLRAIFLFKAHWSLVDEYIFDNLNVCPDSPITIYHANDDDLTFFPPSSLSKKHEESDYIYELEQKKGVRYRSIHYTLQEQKPSGCKVELQTRSILDEAWGEIDHYVRYPRNEHEPELLRKMSILNGLISGCEEHTSQSYKYFTETVLTKLEAAEAEIHKTPENETIVKDLIEDSVRVEDYVEDAKNDVPYAKIIDDIAINSFKNQDQLLRLSKIVKSAYPLRDFEGFDKSNSITKAVESMTLNIKPKGNTLSYIEAMRLASESMSPSTRIAKAVESMTLNTKPKGNALSDIKAMRLASESMSPSTRIAKAVESMTLNTKPKGNALSDIKAMKLASENKKNDDD